MSHACALLDHFFDCLRSLDTCVDLFADDGVFEFPYLSTIGMPSRFEEKAAVRGVLDLIRSHYPAFVLSNIVVHDLKDEHILFVEYHSECPVTGSDRIYRQDYVSRLVERNGKIESLREYMNIISAARELLPNGLAGMPDAAR